MRGMKRLSSPEADEANERLLDALVYAPLGLALEAKDRLPKLAERGRGQVALARLAGSVAAKKGQGEATKAFDELRSSIESFLGCSNRTAEEAAADSPSAPAPAETPVADESDLPIADYSELTAAAIIPMLADLDQEQLAVIEAYERANRSRSTILNRIKQRRS